MLHLATASVRVQRCLHSSTVRTLQQRNASNLSAIKRGIREETPRRDEYPRTSSYRSRDNPSDNKPDRSQRGADRSSPRQDRPYTRNDGGESLGRPEEYNRDRPPRRPATSRPDDDRTPRGPPTRRSDGDRTSGRPPTGKFPPPRDYDNDRTSRAPSTGRYDADRTSRPPPTRTYDNDRAPSRPPVIKNGDDRTSGRPPTKRFDGAGNSDRRTNDYRENLGSRGPRIPRVEESGGMNRRLSAHEERLQKSWTQQPDMDNGYEDGSASRHRTQRLNTDRKPDRNTNDLWRKDDRNRTEQATEAKPPQRGSAAMEDISVPYSHAASEFLYGLNVVYAALKSKKRTLYKLYLHDRASENATKGHDLERLAERVGVTVKRVRNDYLSTMDKMTAGRPHNGVILEASALPVPPVVRLERVDAARREIPLSLSLHTAEERSLYENTQSIPCAPSPWRHPLVLLLDGITDPGNVGNVIRTAYFYGVDAVAICVNTCAPVALATLIKAASGATEAIPILAIQKPADFVAQSSANGWRICAAVAPQSSGPRDKDYHPKKQSNRIPTQTQLHTYRMTTPLARGPSILMMGAEGEGLRENLRVKARYNIAIEGAKRDRADDLGVDSLNVGAATAVLIEAFMRRPQMNFTDRASGEQPVENTMLSEQDGQEVEKSESRSVSVADRLMSMPENDEQAPSIIVTPNASEQKTQHDHMPSPALINGAEPAERKTLKDDEILSLAELENKFKKMTQEAAALETSYSMDESDVASSADHGIKTNTPKSI